MKKTIAIISLVLNALTVISVVVVIVKVSSIQASILPNGVYTEELTIDPNITKAKTADEVFGNYTNVSEDSFADEW